MSDLDTARGILIAAIAMEERELAQPDVTDAEDRRERLAFYRRALAGLV